MPSTLKRKKGAAGASAKINAAPTVESEPGDEPGLETAPRPDLLSTLRSQFGTKEPPSKRAKPANDGRSAAPKGKDDYEKFLNEMSDILGPTKDS